MNSAVSRQEVLEMQVDYLDRSGPKIIKCGLMFQATGFLLSQPSDESSLSAIYNAGEVFSNTAGGALLVASMFCLASRMSYAKELNSLNSHESEL
jgi:hypothetical protein